MIYKVAYVTEDGKTIYARIDDDGLCRVTCTEDDRDLQAWLAEGNTVTPLDAPT